ncbi:hypothetical protein GCM10027599_04050 [Yimella radicis]
MSGGVAAASLSTGASAAFAIDEHERTHREPSYRLSPPSPRTGEFRADVVWRSSNPGIALTFDDGPDPRYTPAILDNLAENSCRATFFVLLDHVNKHPELTRRIAREGHELAVHGADHRDMAQLTPDELAGSMQRTKQAITELTGYTPVLMRPPYGRFDAPVLHAATMQRLRMVLWSDYLPGRKSAAAAERLEAELSDGAIVLCHDGRGTATQEVVLALEDFVPKCVARGLALRTVSDLLADA